MTEEALSAWLALTATPGLGPVQGAKLLRRFGAPLAAWRADASALQEHLKPALIAPFLDGPSAELLVRTQAWLAQPDSHLITLADPHYPPLLLETAAPPLLLYGKGRLSCLQQPGLAMVGSRQASPQGLGIARQFAGELAAAGWCVVSGLALGIDGAAHEGALAASGTTIAVVGTGLDLVYPAKHRELAHQIAAQGLLLSEFALGMPARAANFPRRNRLISGLARGCLVVEAALDSGSLITAREASEQGREVLAIPGSILSPHARGCHWLIRQGARLVESVADIQEELAGWSPPQTRPAPVAAQALTIDAAAPQAPFLAAMGHAPIGIDLLCSRLGLTAAEVSAILLDMELAGQVAPLPGGLYQRLA